MRCVFVRVESGASSGMLMGWMGVTPAGEDVDMLLCAGADGAESGVSVVILELTSRLDRSKLLCIGSELGSTVG